MIPVLIIILKVIMWIMAVSAMALGLLMSLLAMLGLRKVHVHPGTDYKGMLACGFVFVYMGLVMLFTVLDVQVIPTDLVLEWLKLNWK